MSKIPKNISEKASEIWVEIEIENDNIDKGKVDHHTGIHSHLCSVGFYIPGYQDWLERFAALHDVGIAVSHCRYYSARLVQLERRIIAR